MRLEAVKLNSGEPGSLSFVRANGTDIDGKCLHHSVPGTGPGVMEFGSGTARGGL